MKNISILTLAILLVFSSCKTDQTQKDKNSKKETTQTDVSKILKTPEWAKSANIYEVNIRQFTAKGTFNAFAKHLPRLKKMGVDILWLMPIFPISETKKKGTLGSYYAVTDFKKTNPEFGTIEDFKNLVDQAHGLQMKVIIDWVPNHTGWDHVWISEHPEFYTQDKDGNIIDPIDPNTGESWGWTDVADLNYDNQSMRQEMIGDMLFWVNNHKIDGFRMDVAHNVPNDFWADASSQLFAANSDLFMLAESETLDHVNNGYFHAYYGWGMHHLFNDIAKGEKNANDLHNMLMEKKEKMKQGMFMHFITNHDENSWSGTVEERMGPAADAFAVLSMTFDGTPLIYGGQEEPLRKRLEFFEKDDIGFKNYEKSPLYTKLLQLKKRNSAMHNGSFSSKLERVADSEHIYAFTKENQGDKFAVMVNLSNEKQQIKLLDPVVGMSNIFTGDKVEMGEGTIKSFDPWEYWVASNK